jgi:hypothetical protein
MSDQPSGVRLKSGKAGRWGMRRASGLLVLWSLFLLSGLAGLSCAEDDFIEERPRNPFPGALVDGGLGDAEEELCPAIPPKPGENCTTSMENQIRCSFVVGTCNHASGIYDITVDYCCARGTVWDTCGTNTTPCDREAVDAATAPPVTPDAGSAVTPDAGSSGN